MVVKTNKQKEIETKQPIKIERYAKIVSIFFSQEEILKATAILEDRFTNPLADSNAIKEVCLKWN